MGDAGTSQTDMVDGFRDAWRREIPGLDTEPMAILGRINRISHRTAPAIEALFARHGIDRGEFDVIASLRRSGPPYRLAPTDLYRSLMISSGGLTHRLIRLGRAGLITRRASSTDGRSLLVQLTKAGAQLVEAAFAQDMDLERNWISALTAKERSQLAALLRKLHLAVEAETQ